MEKEKFLLLIFRVYNWRHKIETKKLKSFLKERKKQDIFIIKLKEIL